MRCVHWICLFIIVLVITCGCSQPATPPVVTTLPQTPPTLPPAVTTTDAEKSLNFTVTSSTTMVNVTYNGGPDAADLQYFTIRVDNRAGSYNERTIVDPVPGSTYNFVYRGVSDASRVNIVGTFKDGYQQTVLMYYL
ncbi:hypothetical protein [Methanoregula sp.]|uniref:hypothetical protein n=1 Tax=Methanoregula sp. TaxID=2052170 RepID=UPI00236EE2D3|nr:hypothetical protein [Methanoregula sp.]MDD1687533.1 hypothetical protein [Methanoregula sp.]